MEHLLHVFFDCMFANQCWSYVGSVFDMQSVEFAPDWFVQKFSSASSDELHLIARVLWGIWFFINKKVWEGTSVTPQLAMDWSNKFLMTGSLQSWSECRLRTLIRFL